MNLFKIASLIACLLLCYTAWAQPYKNPNTLSFQSSAMDTFEFSPEQAHPNAKVLMVEDFFWSPVEESGPFGSDDGSDAAYGYRHWRLTNNHTSPLVYLADLFEYWNIPLFDFNELDSTKIQEYLDSDTNPNPDEESIRERIEMLKKTDAQDSGARKLDDKRLREIVISSSKSMAGRHLLGQDNAVIGTGFAQFVLEGKVDPELKQLAITSLKRQLLPVLINRYSREHQAKRKYHLSKMLDVVSRW